LPYHPAADEADLVLRVSANCSANGNDEKANAAALVVRKVATMHEQSP
jgi:hypothetical protein